MTKHFPIVSFVLVVCACTDNTSLRPPDDCNGRFLSDVCVEGASTGGVVIGADIPETSASDTAEPKDLPPPGKVCESNFECVGEGACINGHCTIECESDADCGSPADWDCKQFQCFSTKEIEDVGPADTEPPPDDAGGENDPGNAQDEGPPPSDTNPNCTQKMAPYGTTCFCKEDCITGLCLGDITAGKGFCTDECFTSDTCPGSDWCYQDPGGKKVCVKNDAGASCASGCLSGVTLTNQLSQCICTVPCDSASGCPSTMACSAVNLGGVTAKVCVPIGDFCNPNDVQSNCYGICFPDLGGTWLCTATCNSFNDCPVGYTCHQEVLEGQLYQNCLPK